MGKNVQQHKVGRRDPVPAEIGADSQCLLFFGMTMREFVQDYINDTTGKYSFLWADEETAETEL